MNPNKDWNLTNINKLRDKDQTEINLLYNKTKPYFLHKFKDEELFHDIFIEIINKAPTHYHTSGGSFHNWCITIGVNKAKNKYTANKTQKILKTVSFEVLSQETEHFTEFSTSSLEYACFDIEHKEQLENLISKLQLKEREFLELYLLNRKQLTKQRMKYSRILTELRKLNNGSKC